MSIAFENRSTLTATLLAMVPDLPEAQRRVALYLVEHFPQVPLMSATELARASGSSQPSVTRFAARLGFASYSELTQALQSVILQEIDQPVPLERFTRVGQVESLRDLIRLEVENMQALAHLIDSDVFTRCAERIATAQRVYLVGLGAAKSLTVHMHLYLSRLREDVELITSVAAEELMRLIYAGQKDYVFMIVVPRYPKDTSVLAKVLHARGVPIGLATDRNGVAVAPFAPEILLTQITNGPTTAIPASLMLLVSMLVDAVALKNPGRTRASLSAFEELASATGLFPTRARSAKPYWKDQLETFAAKMTETTTKSKRQRKSEP